MKFFNKIKSYILSTCVSFTVVSLLQALLMTEVATSKYLPYHIFFVCICVNITIFLVDQLKIQNSKIRIISHIISVITVVFITNYFILNYLYDSEPVTFTIDNVLLSIILLIFTYLIVYILVCIKNKSDEKSINEQLKKRRKSKKNSDN